jgi:hypothetical protein
MGMGNYAGYADTVEEDFVKEMCADELQAFFLILDGVGIKPGDFAESFDQDDLQDRTSCTASEEQLIKKEWDVLYDAFEAATGGLELGMVYHDADDRGDELDGWEFSVDGVYVLSPAGKKYSDKITRKHWTVFG